MTPGSSATHRASSPRFGHVKVRHEERSRRLLPNNARARHRLGSGCGTAPERHHVEGRERRASESSPRRTRHRSGHGAFLGDGPLRDCWPPLVAGWGGPAGRSSRHHWQGGSRGHSGGPSALVRAGRRRHASVRGARYLYLNRVPRYGPPELSGPSGGALRLRVPRGTAALGGSPRAGQIRRGREKAAVGSPPG